MFYDGWQAIARILIVGTLAYVALVVLLRVSGKRTLSKLNAFDLIVTVALGSTLATVLLSGDVALAEGIAAFALLVGLQLAITWLSVRSARVRGLVKAEPTLLLLRGRFLEAAMARERVTRDELLAAVRASGVAGVGQLQAVVLETDGELSVVGACADDAASALDAVPGYGQDRLLPGGRQTPEPSTKMYRTFAAMIFTSTLIMLPVMYLNSYSLDHVHFSATRSFMAVVMGAVMAVVMLVFMRGMLHSRKANTAVVLAAAAAFGAALWLVRSQATVGDVAYMKAMIPHHSIAILTSERAGIHDPRVRELAQSIAAAQRREIAEMEALIRELEDRR